jgi:apolipoprotein N-acyltransferase
MSSSEVKKSAPKKVQSKSSRAVLKAPSRSRSLETRQSPVERIRVAWNSLVFFAVFFLISVVCWSVTDIAVYKDLFFLLSLVFGAVCVSLILAMLVYFFYSRIKISRS